MFYFESLLNQVLAGIDGTSILRGVTDIAFAILLIGFLTGLYSAAMRGGDLRGLGVTAIKYLVAGIIIANWGSVFRDVNSAFTSVGHLIADGSGAGDMFASWLDQLKQQYATTGNQSLLDMITAAPSALINSVLILVAYVIYPLAVFLFSFFNSMYGALLYVIGPLVLALLPMTGVGQMGRTFALNLMVWNSWAILYGVFGALMTAIHVNDMSTLLNSQGFVGWLRGLPDSLLLGLVSIVYAICIALIPFIAKRLISGDVGSTAGSLVQAATLALATGAAAATGLASGFGSGAAAGSGAGGGAGASAAAATSSSAPTAPAQAPSMASSIKSAVASALSGGSAPTTPSSAAGSGGSGASATSSAAGKGGASSGVPYRPSGTVPSLVYHAAKAAGSAVRQARKA
ncbi:MAG TPA: hypothetical protein VFK06_17650 [Candidatus Angelobacter sp.]|nr:hypothetical protein [Candidatus Angelobacter sp.]